MYTAIDADFDTMVDDVEASWDAVIEAVDDILDEDSHFTASKLMTILTDSLAGLEEDETFQGGVDTIDGYKDEVTNFVDNADFTDTVSGV